MDDDALEPINLIAIAEKLSELAAHLRDLTVQPLAGGGADVPGTATAKLPEAESAVGTLSGSS